MKITQEAFGRFTEYVLTNQETGDAVYIIPKYGGIIRKMTLQKNGHLHKVIDCGETEEQVLGEKSAYPSAHLFPWANRVRNGKYEFQGKHYQLPINEISLNNAIHGLVAFSEFKVTQTEINTQSAILGIKYVYKGEEQGYPYPFELQIQHTFSSDDGLLMTYTIKNTGKTDMPIVLGWHPYFKIDDEKADDWQISIPTKHKYLSDEQMIPKGYEIIDLKEVKPISNEQLDNIFKIESTVRSITQLNSPARNLTLNVWQDAQKGQFLYTVIYIPSTRDRIAIEPMTGNTDAFNSGDGLLILESENSLTLNCGVYLS
ncbi:MAG: aldose 1-epimerase [Arcicella sp.]|nr:aldose 1-epimerase [Arcicella sp.]